MFQHYNSETKFKKCAESSKYASRTTLLAGNLLRSLSPPSMGGMNHSSGSNSYKLTELDVRPPPPNNYSSNGRDYQM